MPEPESSPDDAEDTPSVQTEVSPRTAVDDDASKTAMSVWVVADLLEDAQIHEQPDSTSSSNATAGSMHPFRMRLPLQINGEERWALSQSMTGPLGEITQGYVRVAKGGHVLVENLRF